MKILFFLTNTNREYFGTGYLSTVLKRAGHQVRLARTLRRDLYDKVRSFEPDMLAFSTVTGLHSHFLEVNRRIRRELHGAFSVFGGPHATFFPEMIEEDGVDAVCLGEAEDALLELAERLEHRESYLDVRNFWFKTEGKLVKNGLRPLRRDLDSIPFPDREIFYEDDRNLRYIPIRSIVVGRGCPYSCTYCFNHAMRRMYGCSNREYCRRRSVDNVIEEIRILTRSYSTKFLIFCDDLFSASKKWLEDFAPVYRREFGLPFTCNVRPLSANAETFRLLKEAGCISVQMAVESGNDQIRRSLLGRPESREKIVQTAELVHRHGMKLYTQNMIGLPGETLEQMLETVDLNRVCRPHHSEVTIFQPYPKTSLGEHCKRLGVFSGNPDQLTATYHKGSNYSRTPARVVENLHHFFSVLVRVPHLKPVILKMLKMPRNMLSWLVYRLWYGWEIRYFLGAGSTFVEKLRALRQYFIRTFP